MASDTVHSLHKKEGMYYKRQKVYYATSQGDNSLTGLCVFPPFHSKYNRPGEKIITACIIWDYFENESLYSRRMCEMNANKWLSCDHTFKVAANIGFWWNKSWIKV